MSNNRERIFRGVHGWGFGVPSVRAQLPLSLCVWLAQAVHFLRVELGVGVEGLIQWIRSRDRRALGWTLSADLELTGGSDSTQRVFGRLDSGALGGLGTRVFVSAVDSTTDKWKGSGEQSQRMYTLKVLQPFGENGAKLTAYWNQSERAERDYHDLSYDIIRRRGSDWDNYAPNWTAAVAAGNACAAAAFSAPIWLSALRGARNPTSVCPARSRATSAVVGGATLTTTSHPQASPIVAPASVYNSSGSRAR